jgi:4-amino-4-deoxy-L-arabinose transferase-like glycosyltransferase
LSILTHFKVEDHFFLLKLAMNHPAFLSDRDQRQWRREERWLERFCIGGLLIAAILLFCSNLGSVPLLNGEEATLAQIAKELAAHWPKFSGFFQADHPSAPAPNSIPAIAHKTTTGILAAIADPRELSTIPKKVAGTFQALSPLSAKGSSAHFLTLWGKPILAQPPLVPVLLASSYALGGINLWTTRLPIALLTALSVPGLYCVAKELFRHRLTALYAGLIYLTCWGVICWGRLGSSHGVVLFSEIWLMGAVLRTRRNLITSFEIGLALSLLMLTQPLLGALLAITALTFLFWDTPRLSRSVYFWSGLGLGLGPAIAWYGWQSSQWGKVFWSQIFVFPNGQASSLWLAIIGFYSLKLLQYGLPWLLFAGYGFSLAWSSRHWSWGKAIIIGLGLYFLLICLLPGQWENALTPIYPSLALAGAIALKEVRHLDPTIPYPKIWRFAFFGFSFIFIALTISLYSNFPVQILPQKERPFLLLILIFFSLTLAMTANLLAQRQTEFIPILFWGMFISLLLWVNTPFWLWPKAGDFPVKAIAALIQKKFQLLNQFIPDTFMRQKAVYYRILQQ